MKAGITQESGVRSRKALLLCALLVYSALHIPHSAFGQTATAVTGNATLANQLFLKQTATGRSLVFVDTRAAGVTNHVFTFNTQGGPTSCTLLIEKSDDAVTWSTESTQTCTTNGSFTTATAANFYTANLSALAGGTSPNITVSYRGYMPGQGIPVRETEGGTGTTTQFTACSLVFRGPSSYAQNNGNLCWNDTDKRLCLLSNTCVNSFDIGAGKFFVTSAGAVTAGAGVTAKADAAGNVPLTAQGAASQTADLHQYKNSTGTVLASVSAAGIPKANRLDNNVPLHGTVKSDFTVVTVSNTITETSLNSYSIPANSLAANRTLRITITGVYSTANATDTVTLRAKVGGTAWHSVVSTGATVTNVQWSISWLVIVTATGAGGAAESQVPWVFVNSVFKAAPNTTTQAIDTTLARTAEVSAQWSAALAGNTISVRQFLVEVLN